MKKLLVPVAVAAVAIVTSIGGAASVSKDTFRLAKVGISGGEPSITSAPDGTLYVSYPGSKIWFYRSKDLGKTWKAGGIAPGTPGDTTVNVDLSGAVYQSNLHNVDRTDPLDQLQGEVFKSFDQGKTWPQKGTTATSDNSTNSPFFMDRQWVDVYTPPGKTTNDTRVYISYHDFVPSIIWINVSKDGGKTFSEQRNVISDPVAQANSFCNTIPGGLRVVQSGPRAGRIYVVWMAGSVETNAPTGCNITQLDDFQQLWAAWSDDEGDTWQNALIYDGGFGRDMSTLFADLTLDVAGNPYVTWGMQPPYLPHTGAEGDQWDVYVSASLDGGKTWNGKADGTGEAFKVSSDKGTHFFPAIAAGDPGKVAVAYIATPTVIPQLPYGKPFPGGDPDAKWYVYMARSLDLETGHPTWVTQKLTAKPIHTGDVCTLGIFCTVFEPFGANRDLLDFIDIAFDRAGMVHVAYTDTEVKADERTILVANQITGVPLLQPLTPKLRLPKLPKPKIVPRVKGEKLAGTGVADAPIALGMALVGVAVLVAWRLRRV